MQYVISFTDDDYQNIINVLLKDRVVERAGYLLCNVSQATNKITFLVKEFIAVREEEINWATATGISIKSESYVRVLKQARLKNQSFIFVHSHPSGSIFHSKQDDKVEYDFFKTVYNRIPGRLHGSLVISDSDKPVARIWHLNSSVTNVDLIKVAGKRIKLHFQPQSKIPSSSVFDRQVRAFGPELQDTLKNITVGVVGCGGTGSAVAEQLIRLGVGTLYVYDNQNFEKTNINRVYGSKLNDEGVRKVEIIRRLALEIGLGTVINVEKAITDRTSAETLKSCDIIFGCTDDHLGRSILCRIATMYHIPVLDMGVKVDSDNHVINSIQGRVTFLFPNNACLICRNRISATMILAESMEINDPEAAKNLRKEGYIPELPDVAPSVVTFTTSIASAAINEFLHKLTNFMGSERNSNEIIHFFDRSEIKRNYAISDEDCFCGNPLFIGKGDTSPFLGLTWRNEN